MFFGALKRSSGRADACRSLPHLSKSLRHAELSHSMQSTHLTVASSWDFLTLRIPCSRHPNPCMDSKVNCQAFSRMPVLTPRNLNRQAFSRMPVLTGLSLKASTPRPRHESSSGRSRPLAVNQFFSHFNFSRKMKNFLQFFAKNEIKSHSKNRHNCIFLNQFCRKFQFLADKNY